MEQVPLLDELAIVTALAVAVTVILSKFKLPTVAGILAAGALMGPYGLRLATSIHTIEILAEVGVVLLLFSIGLEFSLDRLQDIFQRVALGGVMQVVVTAGATTGVAVFLGESLHRAVFYGFAFALSSTAIVMRGLAERRELDAPHGRFIVGTLIFQDLCVIPMVLIVPLLSTHETIENMAVSIVIALLKAVVVVIATIVIARFVVPKILEWVDSSRSREVFLLAILALCIGTAWLTSLVGLSLALGAFLGGMVVAGTEYRHRAMSDILPLRDAFVSVFFLSLGMLFDVRILVAQPVLVFALLMGLLVAKGLLATLAALVMRFPARAAWLAGVGLAQFGEFGFVLTRLAEKHQLIDAAAVQPLLSAGIISMFLTPLMVRIAPHITAGERLLAPLERLIGVRSIDDADTGPNLLRDHVVIVGFGVAGQLAAKSLRTANIPHVILELNAQNVRKGKELKMPVFYGDATSEEALRHAHLDEAKLLVLLMNDPQAAQRVVDVAHRVAPNIKILMRSRYLLERDSLFKIGANDVVAEEVEGAIEVIARMLRTTQTPRNIIEHSIKAIRVETQQSDRKQTLPRLRWTEVEALDQMKVEAVVVCEKSEAVGHSLLDLQLRNRTGASAIAICRNNQAPEQPDPQMSLVAGDVLFLAGSREALLQALPKFEPPPIIT